MKRYKIVNRKRFITFITLVILLTVMLFAGIFSIASAKSEDPEIEYIEIRIKSGDTLWNIAKEYGPTNKDIRETVYNICKINNIKASELQAGQIILVPVE